MKILSNFDTKAPLIAYQHALAEFGADKVLFFRRHRIYLTFFIVLPCIGAGILIIVAFLIWRNLLSGFAPGVFGNIFFTVLFGLITIIVLIRILLNYINYLLDYTIVTPRLITSYNQTGIFQREIRTIDTDKVKTITVNANSFLQSLFNYGSINILSEGDEENQ